MTDSQHKKAGGVSRVLPIVAWLPQYNRAWLRSDIIAGLLRMGADGAHCHGLRDQQRRSGAVRPLRGSAWAERVRRVHEMESPEAETYPGIAILRFVGGLFFVNADALGDRLRAER